MEDIVAVKPVSVKKNSQPKKLGAMFLVHFVFFLQVGILLFINSSFLEQHVSIKTIGVIFAAASFLAVLLIPLISIPLRKFGNFATASVFLVLLILALLGLSFVKVTLWVIILFILYRVLDRLVRINADIYIEELSDRDKIGKIRGALMAVMSIALIASFAIMGFLLTADQYSNVYLLGALFTFIALMVVVFKLRGVKDVNYERRHFWSNVGSLWHRKSIRNIFLVNLVLNIFFIWIHLYLPIYLHESIGFSWKTISFLLILMYLPYLLGPLWGKVADTKLGEKELMMGGFLLGAIAIAILPFITSASFIVWFVVLLLSRLGISTAETMKEVYFFKKVDATETSALELFRDAPPIAQLIGPLLASLLLVVIDIRFLFLVLAAILVLGVFVTRRLKDTL